MTHPSAAPRSVDNRGNTALHVAAEAALGSVTRFSPRPRLHMCEALLAAGASVNAVGARSGLTPFGQAMAAKRSDRDFRQTFNIDAHGVPPVDTAALEALLMPTAGLTAADKEVMDS